MSCFKRLAVVAGAVAMMASSSQAAWDMFPVLEAGKVQAKVFSGGKINLRFSPLENLEIFSTNSVDYLEGSNYAIGARYQIVPDMFSAFLDIGIPDPFYGDHNQGLGLVPGIQFSTNFTEQFSLGLLVGLGVDLDYNTKDTLNSSLQIEHQYGVMMHLGTALELGYSFNDNFGAFLGTSFDIDRISEEKRFEGKNFEIKDALGPYFGVYYSVEALTVATSLGLELNARDKKGKETVALSGGVDLTITF